MKYRIESGCFIKGNFSWNLNCELPTETQFVKHFAGKVDSDIKTIYSELKKEHTKHSKKSTKEEKSTSDK